MTGRPLGVHLAQATTQRDEPVLESTYRLSSVWWHLVGVHRDAGAAAPHPPGGDEVPPVSGKGRRSADVLKAHDLTSVAELWFVSTAVEQSSRRRGRPPPSGWEEIAVPRPVATRDDQHPNPDSLRAAGAPSLEQRPRARGLVLRLANGGYDWS